MKSFLIGLGAGLTVGLLFAPKSGAKTREFIVTKATEGGEFLAHQGQQIKETAADLLDKGRKVVKSQRIKLADLVRGEV